MAALLCDACSDVCEAGANMVAATCDAATVACATLVGACGAVMAALCPEDKPLPIFVSFTFLSQLGPGIAGIVLAALHWGHSCPKPLHIYLMVSFLICGCNMGFASYMYSRLANPRDDEVGKSFVRRGWHMFLYDPMIIFWGLLWIGAVVWNVIGTGWVNDSRSCQSSDPDLYDMSSWMGLLMWLFLFGGWGVMFISAMCESCRESDRPRQQQRSQQARRPLRNNAGPVPQSRPPTTGYTPARATAPAPGAAMGQCPVCGGSYPVGSVLETHTDVCLSQRAQPANPYTAPPPAARAPAPAALPAYQQPSRPGYQPATYG